MKKRLLTLFGLLFTINANGVEVINFDIKGTKLGMTPEEVMSRRNCIFSNLKGEKINGIISRYVMFCHEKITPNNNPNRKNYDYSTYSFDKDKKLYHVGRLIRYGTGKAPEWKAIDADIIKKYGKPNIKGNFSLKKGKQIENNVSNCWGKCSIKDRHNGSSARGKEQGISFRVEHGLMSVSVKPNSRETKEHHELYFSLTNADIWYPIFYKEYPKHSKKTKKTNSIDL